MATKQVSISPAGYARLLGLTRSRLFTAVVMPALIGGAYAYSKGHFSLLDFVLILVGLVCAELLNLLGYDYNHYLRRDDPAFEARNPRLPGNPVFSRLPGRLIPAAVAVAGLVGLGVLLYFTFSVGPAILALMGAAVAVGALYLFPFFPHAYLSTALLPPILAGGVYMALSGSWEWGAFWSGLPIAWISVAVILNYRIPGPLTRERKWLLAGFYLLAAAHIALWALLGLYPPSALGVALAIVGGVVWLVRAWAEAEDSIPSTTVGVLIHAAAALLVALALMISSL